MEGLIFGILRYFFKCHKEAYLAVFRELKQQRWRRLRKSHLKSEVALLQILSRLFHFVQFVKCWQYFLEFSSKRLYCPGKEKESRCFEFTSSTKREVKHFLRRSPAVTAKKCTEKRDARAGLFFQSNLLFFCRSR